VRCGKLVLREEVHQLEGSGGNGGKLGLFELVLVVVRILDAVLTNDLSS
jgi:hypothetical protein